MKKLTKKQVLNQIVDKTNLDSQLSKVQLNNDEYYSIIKQYGITDKLNTIIDSFPDITTNHSSLFKKFEVNIGIICDEFLYYSLKDAANFTYIPYTDNLSVNDELDMLLVVTSWRGLDHTWDYVANPKSQKRQNLIELIIKYKDSKIPTVFYSKEDPISYKEYLSLAKECDYIFTSAKEIIDDYKRDTGNDNVDYMEFGVNPMYHNPIGKNLSDNNLNKIVTFAGSWMVRYPERNKEALELYKGVKKSGFDLSIIDRQYEREMKRYHYPSYLLGNVSATIPHERLMKLHKATMWGINLNSVKNSNTMFANRVYELQALGNLIISNYNKGVHSKFPHVYLAGSSIDVQNILNNTNKNEQRKVLARGISEVMLNHTSYHRIAKLVSKTGIKKQEIRLPKVLVIGENLSNKSDFNRQFYKNKTFVTEEYFRNFDNYEEYDFICYFSKNNVYEEHYIENLVSAFVYSEADVVTMNNDNYDYVENNKYIKENSMVKSMEHQNLLNNSKTIKFFNIPKSEIIEYIPENKGEEQPESNKKTELSIIIPVFKDYEHLEYKSIQSINNTILMDKAKITILCCGEENTENRRILERIQRIYNNVEVYENYSSDSMTKKLYHLVKKIETPYISILNVQDQLIPNKFAYLLDLFASNSKNEVALGKIYNPINTIEEEFDSPILNKYYNLSSSLGSMIFKSEYLKSILHESDKITEKELLFQVLGNSDKSSYYDVAIYNKLENEDLQKLYGYDYLSDAYENEKFNMKIMKDMNLIEEYTNRIFPHKFMNEYFEEFKRSKYNKLKCYEKLKDIYHLYSAYYNNSNERLNNITDLIF